MYRNNTRLVLLQLKSPLLSLENGSVWWYSGGSFATRLCKRYYPNPKSWSLLDASSKIEELN